MIDISKTLEDTVYALTKTELGKLYYRRGEGFLNDKKYDDAKECLEIAMGYVPDDMGIKRQIAVVQKGQDELKRKERMMYAQMFS